MKVSDMKTRTVTKVSAVMMAIAALSVAGWFAL
jgi:hypothetical protein